MLVVLMAFGLSKLSGGQAGTITVPVDQLIERARWIKATGETKVTVVEFSDVQCPACKQAEPIGIQLREMAGVKFVYRHFPLITIHKNSWKGARALEAVRLIDGVKGWQMMELMFAKQEEWSGLANPDEKFAAYAVSLGVNEKDFVDKYTGNETDKLIGEDSSLGDRLALSGTPTFFVEGEQVAVPYVLDKVKSLLK